MNEFKTLPSAEFLFHILQGISEALLDSTGATMVKYKYDAWGNCQTTVIDSTATEIATLNPFRYRSYYYDTETKLYFLKTRYYDPEIGRFITIDDLSYLDPETVNGLNLYAYCANNPIMYLDLTGHSWESFWDSVGDWFKENWVKLAIGAAAIILGAVVTALTAGAGIGFMAAFGSALLASAKAVGVSMVISAGIGAVVGGITDGLDGALRGFANGLADGFMWGGIFAGSAQILGGASKLLASRNVSFSSKTNWLYGNRNSQSTTLLRVNKAGKQLFRIDADVSHLWHLHYGKTSVAMRLHRTGIVLIGYLGVLNIAKGFSRGF